jgi:signal transduction histidine kinase
LIASQEQERQRIARELHDSLGQDLLLIKNFALLGVNENLETPKVAERFADISKSAARALTQVREISYALRPEEFDRLGLTKAIRAMVNQASESSNIEFDLEADQIDGLLPPEFEINLYRVVQESISNILKHSQAQHAQVQIRREVRFLFLSIRDDGRGFDAAGRQRKPAGERGGAGLAGIEERVRIMGGRMELGSTASAGTLVRVTIPVRQVRALDGVGQRQVSLASE